MNDIRKKAKDYAKFKHQEEYNDPSYHRDVLETIKDFEAGYKKALAISRVGKCNCDKETQMEEEYDIQHLINNTYQVVGKETGTVWKQGTMEECNDWVML